MKAEKVGSVYINKESFYLRAYLPSKVNPDWTKLKQQWVTTGLKADRDNLAKVEKLVHNMEYSSIEFLDILQEKRWILNLNTE